MNPKTNTPYKIMLVDDDHFLLDMYVMKFKEAGYDVESYVNGGQLIEKLRAGATADAIVLDVVMPGIDGLTVLKMITDEKLGGDAVHIMLSNQGQDVDLDQARKNGADGYIIKATAIPSEVVTRVTDIIQSKRP